MTTTRNRFKVLLPAAMLLFSFHCLQAQVTIGADQAPHNFSILELASDSKGLRLPQLTTVQRNAWSDYFLGKTATKPSGSGSSYITTAEKENARGLVIYNISTGCMEYWNTQKWILLCDQTCAEPVPATVIPLLDQSVSAPAGADFTLGPVSVGYTSGSPQTAYKWYSNDTNDYDAPTLLTGETSNTLTDSKTAGTYYYFCEMTNADCTGNSVRTGIYTVAVASTPLSIPLGPGTLSGKTCFDINKSNWDDECGTQVSRASLAVDFANLGDVIYTFTAPNSETNDLRFEIEDPVGCVTSYSGGKLGKIYPDEKINLTVNYETNLSDVPGKIFGRTRNGAAHVTIYAIYHDGTQEVSVPLLVNIQDCICCGAYVAAGVWKEFMCHNLGADQGLNPFTPAKGLNGDYFKWGRKDPVATVDTPPATPSDWPSGGSPATSWLEDSKTANDPCPQGYRVPTRAEWEGVIDTTLNPQTEPSGASWTEDETNFSSGRFFGPGLYLPAAGLRGTDGYGSGRGSTGFYWSSRILSITQATRLCIYEQGKGDTFMYYYTNSTFGHSVRCIAE